MEEKTDSLEQKYNAIIKERAEWKEERNKWLNDKQELETEIDRLKQATLISKGCIANEHSGDFWQDLRPKCRSDPEYVKGLVKNKILTVFDRNPEQQTLLILATIFGSYELVQFCINSGADIDAKDKDNKTALDQARKRGYYHIEQLLLFSQMNVNIGNEIQNTANNMHKQNGIICNILNELSLIGEQSKELFEKILMEITINIINKRLLFSDDILNLCWNIASRKNNALSSSLWKSISSTCCDIIQHGNKRDWQWLKTCIIPSTIWFSEIYLNKTDEKSSQYLYYQLLNIVNVEANHQLNELEKDLNKLANENQTDWDKLTKWDIPNQYETVRQDVIPNGIVSRYSYNQLSESSGTTFNSPEFYDYNQYLSQLVLLAQIVDDEFQGSVQEIFKIDKVTHEGVLKFNNNSFENDEKKKNIDGKIKYMRGPVKLIDRARSKAQNDYVNEEYPASACILDLNRCALVFNDISTLLLALDLFVNKVKYYQSGNIIGIVRDKNGFVEYIKQTQYADIKLNVLIKGKHNNIIGEVQFLLKTMKEFKDKAHNLYAIQRQQESMESSVCKILPMLLDEDKQIFIAGNRGNVKGLCQLMVINNKSIKDIMKIDKDTGNTILHRIASLGHQKAFLFLKSLISKQAFIKYALTPNKTDINPSEFSVAYGRVSIAKILFDIEEIQHHYKNKNNVFKICFHSFQNPNHYLTDYILNLLNITNDNVREMMTFQHFGRRTILTRLSQVRPLKNILKLVQIIGNAAFIDNVFFSDDCQCAPLEYAILQNKLKMVEYMLSFKEIKDRYLNDDNWLFRIIYWLFVKNGKKNMINYVLSQLQISNDKIKKLITFQCVAPSKKYGSDAYKYHLYSIIARIAFEGTLDGLKMLIALIGEKVFYEGAVLKDGWNENAIQNAIKKKRLDFIKYMMHTTEIKNKCSTDNDELYNIISTLNTNFDDQIASYIVHSFNLTQAKLNDLKTYRSIDITKISHLCE